MLKAINHPGLTNTLDPGRDGNNGFRSDVFGLALDYYSGDYLGNTTLASANGISSSYNGNIAMMRWGHINKNAGTNLQWAYKVSYDNQNFLKAATFGKYNSSTRVFSSESNYSVSGITYDANGNLLTLRRNGNGTKINMDLLTYSYPRGYLNRLDHITDAYGNAGLGDLASQTAGNYQYNQIGQLKLSKHNNQTFTYDVTGKVTRVTMPAGNADYKYDDGGFRSTTITPAGTTHYIRDVSGNILAVYDANGNVLEYPVYGGSRLGVAFVKGNTTAYNYEISDHLGNVRAIVSKTDSLVVEGYADYYPFGWQMPGRIAKGSNTYRFGYQGQFAEDDTETTGYNQFEARLYDSRLGRWLTTDPAGQYYSPYLAMGNSPFMGVDPDGRFFTQWLDNNGEIIADDGTNNGTIIRVGDNGCQDLLMENNIWMGSLDDLNWYINSQSTIAGYGRFFNDIKQIPNQPYSGLGIDAFLGDYHNGTYIVYQNKGSLNLYVKMQSGNYNDILGNVYSLRSSLGHEHYHTLQAKTFPAYPQPPRTFTTEADFIRFIEFDAIRNFNFRNDNDPWFNRTPNSYKQGIQNYEDTYLPRLRR
jgi:RHS repeat-associated protein